MPTIKNAKRGRFTTISNVPLNDPEISFRAKGILAYLVGKPEDWSLRLEDLINRATEGRDAVRSSLKELKDKGYMKVVVVRDLAGKIIDNVTYVSDDPSDLGDLTDLISRTTEKPASGQTELRLDRNPVKPNAGESDGSNIESKKKKRLTKEEQKLLELVPGADPFRSGRMVDSDVAEWEIFVQFFEDDVYTGIDVRHYFEAISDWSNTKKVNRTAIGWVSTVRGSIRRDVKEGKVRRVASPVHESFDYLKLGRT